MLPPRWSESEARPFASPTVRASKTSKAWEQPSNKIPPVEGEEAASWGGEGRGQRAQWEGLVQLDLHPELGFSRRKLLFHHGHVESRVNWPWMQHIQESQGFAVSYMSQTQKQLLEK